MKPFSLVVAALALLQSGVVATDTVLKYTSYHDDSTCKGTSYYAAAWDTGADCSANATACTDSEGMYYSATCSSDSPSTLMSGNIGQATYSDSACSSTALLTDTVSVDAYTKDACFFAFAGAYMYATTSSNGDVEVYEACSSSACADCTLYNTYSTTTCSDDSLGFDSSGFDDSSGSCYSSTSTATRLAASGHGTEQVPLTALAEGHRILALDQHAKPIFATVERLPHGPAAEPYVRIAMQGKAKHELQATLHHTFDACAFDHSPWPPHAAKTASTVQAQHLKAGDCLHTAEGKAMVRSVKRVAPQAGDVTYSIKLAGGVGTVAIGGVFTHAMGHAQRPGHGADAADKKKASPLGKAKINEAHIHLPHGHKKQKAN